MYRDKMRQMYLYFETKRLKYAELELEHIDKYLQLVDAGVDLHPDDFGQNWNVVLQITPVIPSPFADIDKSQMMQ